MNEPDYEYRAVVLWSGRTLFTHRNLDVAVEAACTYSIGGEIVKVQRVEIPPPPEWEDVAAFHLGVPWEDVPDAE